MAESTKSLRALVAMHFPAGPFHGNVTGVDGASTADDHGIDDCDEQALSNGLAGRRWTEVDRDLLRSHPDGYLLLTAEAYRDFIAAWLSASLDDIHQKNEIREFVIYSFSNTAQELRALDAQQRRVVRAICVYFSETEASSFLKNLATQAVENVDRLERNIVANPWLVREEFR